MLLKWIDQQVIRFCAEVWQSMLYAHLSLQMCVICKQIHGSCTQCYRCSTYYHAICASRAGYRMEVHQHWTITLCWFKCLIIIIIVSFFFLSHIFMYGCVCVSYIYIYIWKSTKTTNSLDLLSHSWMGDHHLRWRLHTYAIHHSKWSFI